MRRDSPTGKWTESVLAKPTEVRRCSPIKPRQLSTSLFCLVYGCAYLFKDASKQTFAFHILQPATPDRSCPPPSLTSYTINMAKESRTTRNNARYEPYNSSRCPNRRRESSPPNSLGNQRQIHYQQPDGSIYGFLDDLYSCYGGADMAQLFRKYAGQSGVLGEGITMWLLFNDVSTLPHYGSPSRPTRGWLIGTFRCASVARQTLSAPPRVKRLIP